MSDFRSWKRQGLEKRFGLKRIKDHPILKEWLAMPSEITDFERISALRLQAKLVDYVDYWNEDELKLKFIGSLISLVDFDTAYFSAFANRMISAIVDGEELSGKPDLILGTGTQDLEVPYFCLHEYKKEMDNNSPDPAGQCLAAMLAAQALNSNPIPIYGTYVIGRNWFFIVLVGNQYSISNGYMATQEEIILDILRILKTSKQIVTKEVKQSLPL